MGRVIPRYYSIARTLLSVIGDETIKTCGCPRLQFLSFPSDLLRSSHYIDPSTKIGLDDRMSTAPPITLILFMVAWLLMPVAISSPPPRIINSNRNGNSSRNSSNMPTSSGNETISQTIQDIVDDISSSQKEFETSDNPGRRPFVTLAFAQSLDGKIAVYLDGSRSAAADKSSNFPISGRESLRMTHALRSIHDAILVGGKTLAIDNPRLSNRLWGTGASRMREHRQPRPVILDTHLRHLQSLGEFRRAKNLIVCCSQDAAAAAKQNEEGVAAMADVALLPVPLDDRGRIDLNVVLQRLREDFGIQSVMVEGGSTVLSSFVERSVGDCFCVTVSPKLLGQRGVPSIATTVQAKRQIMGRPRWYLLGSDCILISNQLVDFA